MTACCTTEIRATSAAAELCSLCGRRGVSVEPITLKALLVPEALRRGVPPAPRFCATPECSVVYFDHAAGVTFRQSDVTVRVHAKHPGDADVPVCYCFGVNPGMIAAETRREGTSSVSRAIRADVKAGRCACEVRNPKGSCCLGDVAAVEKAVLGGLG